MQRVSLLRSCPQTVSVVRAMWLALNALVGFVDIYVCETTLGILEELVLVRWLHKRLGICNKEVVYVVIIIGNLANI